MHDYAELHASNPQKMWQLARRNPMGSNRHNLYGNRWPVVRWYDMKEVYMTSLEASRRDKLNFVKALKQRKLALVLDLDETILHSMSGRAEDTPIMRAVARKLKGDGAAYSSEILIGEFITKLRPGAREFLSRVNEKYSIYVHTKGKKGYKKWLLSEIDPSGKIFPPGVVDRLASYQDVCVLPPATSVFIYPMLVADMGMRTVKVKTGSSCNSPRHWHIFFRCLMSCDCQ